ncbi:MAG: branched-chain amino acid ABC transporter permease [Geminicoccaceae bacterium]|nr:branched-chain amino acid ABC transporter permease [Geminicoccaceae bacterium]
MKPALFLAGILLCAIAPWIIPNSQVLLTIALSKGLAVLGVIVLLQAGQVSFGHALFYAIAAYGTAFLGKYFGGGELFLAMAIGTISAALAGLLVGLFVVRYRHIFFGMLNLSVSMIFFSILEKFYFITGGSDGLRVERPSVLGIAMERGPFEVVLFYVALVCAVLAMILIHRFLSSPLGNHLRAIKSNEVRLEYLGVSPRLVLLKGYIVSAALCGLGGSLMAVTLGVVTPEYAWWVRSGEFVFIAILGGSGSVGGAFVGALVYEGVRTYASAFAADVWQLILGGVLLVVILFAPKGLIGFIKQRKASNLRPRSSKSAAGEALSK